MRSQRTNGLCGSDCAYRRLYEGSQASLADMAGKQADALNRVARLRSAIVSNLKQTFPVEFGAAEAHLSKRLSATDDEVLLAYLSGFLALPTRSIAATAPPPAGVADLREELEALGVAVPAGTDFAAWATAVAEFAQAAAAQAAQAAQAAAAQQPPATEIAADGQDAAPPKPRRRTGAGSLLDGATATGYDPGSKSAARRTTVSADEPDPDPATEPATDAATGAATDPATDPVQGQQVPAADLSVGDDEDIPWGDEPEPRGDLHDLFEGELVDSYPGPVDPESATPDTQTSAMTGTRTVTATGAVPREDLGDLFGDEEAGPLSSLFADELSDDADSLVDALFTRDDENTAGAGTPPPPVHAFPTPPTTAGLASAADGLSPASPDRPERTEASATPGAKPNPSGAQAKTQAEAQAADPRSGKQTDAPAAGGRGAAGSTLRPELFPSTQMPKGKSTRRATRTSRVSAAPPDPRGLDVPMAQGATGADLTDELFNKLVASVCIPRPVFISDLVAQVGSKDLVDAWEQRCRDMGTSSPVRFITPKARHRDRGSLIVPHSPELRKAASEFTRSWWATCLDERRLRGAKLYEVAVLLHRFGESIISSRIEGDVVVLRVNQARGLVGVVVALETDLAGGGTTRGEVADAVGELLADRLTLVAILTYASGGGTLEKLAAAVREEAETRGWQPTAPVIASASWDFAADGGASALAVL